MVTSTKSNIGHQKIILFTV